MKKLLIDFDEIQKAMEDVSREAFEYFLDVETGVVIILSEDIIDRAQNILENIYDEDMSEFDEVEFDEEQDIPDWMEDEIELALDIFLDEQDRYVRIPERDPNNGYAAMKAFTNGLRNSELRKKLSVILDGKGAFRRFKDTLETYPKERKLWYGFNAQANRRVIETWLTALGIQAVKES